jgi:hypothetical protein
MTLSASELETIEALLAAPEADPQALRRQFPHLSVTRCDPSDIDTETPFRTWPHLSLYLVESADHCWRLTGEPERATGIVIVAHPGTAA